MEMVNSGDGIIKKVKVGIFKSELALKKKHNAADTSIVVYKDLIRTGKVKSEQELVYDHIRNNQPLTSRQIGYDLDKERGNITRSIFNLVALGRIKVAYTAKCEYTDRTVSYYTTVDWAAVIELALAA